MTKKRKNQSKNPDMGECVKAYDEHTGGGGVVLSMREWHKQQKIKEKFGIPLKSFWMYARSDKESRRKTKQQLMEEMEERHRLAMQEHYKNISQPVPIALLMHLEQQQREEPVRREELIYQQLMGGGYELAQGRRKLDHKFWTKCLHVFCTRVIEKDRAFANCEKELLEQCIKSFGIRKVQYVGPGKDEKGEGAEAQAITDERRLTLKRELDGFRLFQSRLAISQTRQALDHAASVKTSMASMTCLSVAIDLFLGKYEDGVVARGLERPNLQKKFREVNHLCSEKIKRQKHNSSQIKTGGEEASGPILEDTGLSTKEKDEHLKHLTIVTNNDHSINEEALSAAHAELRTLRNKIFECAKQITTTICTGPDLCHLRDMVQKIERIVVEGGMDIDQCTNRSREKKWLDENIGFQVVAIVERAMGREHSAFQQAMAREHDAFKRLLHEDICIEGGTLGLMGHLPPADFKTQVFEILQKAATIMQTTCDFTQLTEQLQRMRSLVLEEGENLVAVRRVITEGGLNTDAMCNEEWLRDQIRQIILESLKNSMAQMHTSADLQLLLGIVEKINAVVLKDGLTLTAGCDDEWFQLQLRGFGFKGENEF